LSLCYSAPPPFTLWFVNMIVLFYLIAPLLIGLRGNEVAYIALCSVNRRSHDSVSSGDGTNRHAPYPLFPLLRCRHISGRRVAAVIDAKPHRPPTSRHSCLSCPTLARPSWELQGDLWAAPWALFGSIAVFVVVMRVCRNLKSPPILTQFSEASFFMYLLHRPLYLWMQTIWFPSTEKEQVPYLLFVCLPIIGIVAWLCQRAYTGFLQRREVRVAAPN